MINISHYVRVWWTYYVDVKPTSYIHPLWNSGNRRCPCVIKPVTRNTEQDVLSGTWKPKRREVQSSIVHLQKASSYAFSKLVTKVQISRELSKNLIEKSDFMGNIKKKFEPLNVRVRFEDVGPKSYASLLIVWVIRKTCVTRWSGQS